MAGLDGLEERSGSASSSRLAPAIRPKVDLGPMRPAAGGVADLLAVLLEGDAPGFRAGRKDLQVKAAPAEQLAGLLFRL